MAQDTSAPSWWNSLYPDYEAYEAALTELLPPLVPIGPVPVPREVVILGGWFTPFGQSGLYTRLAIALNDAGVPPSQRGAVWSQVQDQATSAGFGDGGGFGGSFGYRAERTSEMVTIIPDAYRVSIEAQSGGQAIVNVVGVLNGSGSALAAAQAVQTAWKVASGPLSSLPNTYTLEGFRALDMSDPNGDIAFVADASTGGAGAVQKSTNGACALVKWNGGTRSRSSRGRLYYGPLSEGQIDADGRTVAPVARAVFETNFANFRSSLAGSGYPLAVLSIATSSAFLVTSSAVETIIATQRRRIRS